MTIEKALGLKSMERFNYDHSTYYGMVINLIGFEKVKGCVPFTEEEIRKAYKKDKHLNNLLMKTWDYAGGFAVTETRYDQYITPINSTLRRLLKEAGVTCYSCAEGVCILKECARRMVEENGQQCH